MEEYLLKIDKTNPADVVQRLKDKGIQVVKSKPHMEDLPMLAFRLRQTKEYQQSSKRRKKVDKDKDWGEIFDAH